jgi:type II secretory pathway pseudopilin PulG
MIQAQPQSTRFTLMELLCAMAVLLLLMAVLFQFLSSADRAWRGADTNARIHESAQILFDIITRDLQSAVYDDQPGGQIPFYVGTNAGADANTPYLAFVSATDAAPGTTPKTRLVEVHYKCRTAAGTPAQLPYWFRRSVVDDTDSDWDFYGDPTPAPFAAASSGTPAEVIYGVHELAFECYDRGGNTLASTACASALPAAVRVNVTLFDPGLADAPEPVRANTYRSFSKLIFLGGR